MNSPLLVPVNVNFLLVRKGEDVNCVGPTHSFEGLPYIDSNGQPVNKGPYLGDRVVKGPFEKDQLLPLGAHLHWLPSGAGGRVTSDGRAEFREAPHIWLVVRLVSRKGKALDEALKLWIVESDHFEDGIERKGQSVSVPLPSAMRNKLPFGWLGRVCSIEEHLRGGNRLPWSLTAVGYAGPEFSALLPNCRGVFGMHDDQKDLAPDLLDDIDVKLSYIVIGWGGAGLGSHADKAETLAERGWALDGATQGLDGIDDVLYHGAVRWAPKGPEGVGPLRGAIGSSPVEALSALVANLAGDAKLERVLNLIQLGLLEDNADLDASTVGQALHEAGFRAETAERGWGLRSKVEHPKVPRLLPTEVDQALRKLVDEQRRFDRRMAFVAAARWQLFSDGARLLRVRHMEMPDGDAQLWLQRNQGKVGDYLDKIRDELKAAGKEPRPDDQRVRAMLKDEDYELIELSEPRHWRPDEPHLLLLGEPTRPAARYEGVRGTDDGGLTCRRVAELIRKVRSNGHDLSAEAVLDAGALASLRHPDVLRRIVEEAFLLDHKVDGEWEVLEGMKPAEWARSIGGKPWIPTALHWRADFHPLDKDGDKGKKDYPAEWIKQQFVLTSPELECRKAPPNTAPNRYEGITLLSSTARTTLRCRLEPLIKRLADKQPGLAKRLAEISKNYGSLPLLSQSLEGLHDELLMKQHALQMDIKDPIYEGAPGGDPYASIKEVVGGGNTHAPRPTNWFNPIRAGLLKLQRLRVVDAFGQFVDPLKDGTGIDVIVGESLRVPRLKQESANTLFIPPRLPQPARLDLRWLPGPDGSTPLCGWLSWNRLDQSLMVHTAAGQPLGALVLGEKAVSWRNGPGSANPDRTWNEVRKALEVDNPNLVGLLDALKNDADYARSFVACLQHAIRDEGRHDSLFGGRPLAVARLSAHLQVRDAVALDQGWLAFKETISAFIDKRECGYDSRRRYKFDAVRFPVRLGDNKNGSDGLVGYFAGNRYDTFWSQFEPKEAERTPGQVRNPDRAGHPLECCLADKSGHEATLIFDPQARIHVATGILPVKAIDLSPSLHEASRARLRHALFVAPLLTNELQAESELTLLVPHSTSPQVAWTWIERKGEGNAWRKIQQDQLRVPGETESQAQVPWVAREGWLQFERKG